MFEIAYKFELLQQDNKATLQHVMTFPDGTDRPVILMEVDSETGEITIYPSGLFTSDNVHLCNWTLDKLGLQHKPD